MRQIQGELWPSIRPRIGTTTFLQNTVEPIHRWFRYSAGFSASWVNQVIRETKSRQEVRVLDPFVGSGTVLLEAEHGGKKQYDIMIASYFADLARVWVALRRCCAPEATVCFVVGDSAPYGVHVPVERWLGGLAVAAGVRSWRFEKLRDRNTKWKNRKHRVLLHEGRLWVH